MQERASKIVDSQGRPFKTKEAQAYQTDDVRLASLHRTFSEHPSSGLTPARAAEILIAAEQGDIIAQCELAEDMEEKDGHLYAELDKRKRALVGVDWQIQPPRNPSQQERDDADYLSELLSEGNYMAKLIKDMADGIHKGFAMLELSWHRELGEWFVDAPEYRDPSWFMPHPERRNELRLRDATVEGVELWPFGWISHLHPAKSGYLSRSGLVRQLVWPFIFKNYSIRDLAEFLEIYGLPLRIGQYPSGASADEKSALLQAVMSIGHNAGGIMPKGMVMDFHSAASGQADPFELMFSWAEKTMSKVVLGGTLTSQADGKSSTNALGNVHNEVRQELRDSDLMLIAETLSRDLVMPLYALNCSSFQSPRRYPRLVFDTTEAEDFKQLAYPLRAFVSMGMQIPQQWLHDKTRIPKPVDGEAVLTMPKEPGAEPAVALAALAATTANKTFTQDALSEDALSDNSLAQMTERLSSDAGALMASLMEPVADAVLNASSLEELRDSIMELELDDSALRSQLQKAIAAAYLLGQIEVEGDAQEAD